MRLSLEIETVNGPVRTHEIGSDLVALMSFAVVRDFGAQHPLITMAERLAGSLGVRLNPLTNFYERQPEDDIDEKNIELTWQDPSSLEVTLLGLGRALNEDSEVKLLAKQGRVDNLKIEIETMLPLLSQAARDGRRVRLLYDL